MSCLWRVKIVRFTPLEDQFNFWIKIYSWAKFKGNWFSDPKRSGPVKAQSYVMWNDVSSKLQIPYDTYGIVYVPVNFAFNLQHYVTGYLHHRKEVKQVKKEEKKKRLRKNVPLGRIEPGPSELENTTFLY